MIKIDPHERIDLAGTWAGFGFAEAAPRASATRKASTTAKSSVIYLAEALRIRRERRLGVRDPGPDAEASNVVYMSRGPRPRQRV
ncbi:hypothetical protein ACQ5SB_11310 [Stenotrophomonas geniculata]|uniref:hypothetical protein n=1 Tax=Stenotrophomonas TaxID=40323 RepID=UPI003D3435AB